MIRRFFLISMIFLSINPAFSIEERDLDETIFYRSFRQELDSSYETILTPDSSRELNAIQKTLDPMEFPVLPMSYRFETLSDKKTVPIWNIQKHPMAPDVSLGLYVFGALERGKLAYVIHHDGKLAYSYGPTRTPSYQGSRTPFSFKKGEITYVDGHTLDHAHTPEEKLNFYPGTLSTNNIATHLPEPSMSYWGLYIRNPLVKSIAALKGNYGQWSYYADTPEWTDGNKGIRAPIPTGVLFFEHTPRGHLINGWNIPWNDPIHRTSSIEEGPRNKLRSYQLPWSSKNGLRGYRHLQTLSYTYPHVHETMLPQVDVESLLDEDLDPFMRYRLEILADSELEANYSSILYLNGLLTVQGTQERAYRQTCYWGSRALEYISGLEAYDVKHFIGNIAIAEKILKELRSNQLFDQDRSEEDVWHQMLGNQKDVGSRFLSHIGSFEEEDNVPSSLLSPITPNPTLYDITLPTGKGSASQTIQPSPSEFTTPRALRIHASGGKGWDTKRALLFLRMNKDFLREHRSNISSITFAPPRLEDHKDVKKCLEKIFNNM